MIMQFGEQQYRRVPNPLRSTSPFSEYRHTYLPNAASFVFMRVSCVKGHQNSQHYSRQLKNTYLSLSLSLYIYICYMYNTCIIYMCVCMYVCMYACMYVCMCISLSLYIYIYICVKASSVKTSG